MIFFIFKLNKNNRLADNRLIPERVDNVILTKSILLSK